MAARCAQNGLLTTDGAFAQTSMALGDKLFYNEAFSTSPLILSPFTDLLTIPKALAPVPQSTFSTWTPPGPGVGQQNSYGNDRHQIWTSQIQYPDPIVYKIDLLDAIALVHHLEGAADRCQRPAHHLVRHLRRHLYGRHQALAAGRARSTASTGPSPAP